MRRHSLRRDWYGFDSGLLAAMVIPIASLVLAASPAKVDRRDLDAGVRATLDRFYDQNPQHRALVRGAGAVLVVPDMRAPGRGGESGQGELRVDDKSPGYYLMTGAPAGAAAAPRSVILLFTAKGRDDFIGREEWTVGSDLQVTAGHAGAAGVSAQQPVVAYVFDANGPVADASLQGAKLTRLP